MKGIKLTTSFCHLQNAKRIKTQSTARSPTTQRLDAVLLVQTNPPYHFSPCLPGRSADFSEGAGTTVRTQRPKGSTDTIGLESLWQAPGQISSKKFCTLISFQQKYPKANFHCKLSATRRAKSDPDIHSASEGAQEVGPNVIPGFLRLEASHWM